MIEREIRAQFLLIYSLVDEDKEVDTSARRLLDVLLPLAEQFLVDVNRIANAAEEMVISQNEERMSRR